MRQVGLVPYPRWTYFPSNVEPPPWVAEFVDVVAALESTVSTETVKTGLSSDAVLALIAPGLVDLGYTVEDGRKRVGKVRRPVLFGENGEPGPDL